MIGVSYISPSASSRRPGRGDGFVPIPDLELFAVLRHFDSAIEMIENRRGGLTAQEISALAMLRVLRSEVTGVLGALLTREDRPHSGTLTEV